MEVKKAETVSLLYDEFKELDGKIKELRKIRESEKFTIEFTPHTVGSEHLKVWLSTSSIKVGEFGQSMSAINSIIGDLETRLLSIKKALRQF